MEPVNRLRHSPLKSSYPVEKGVHDAGAPGIGEKLVTVADKGPGRRGKFHPHPAFAVVDEAGHLPLAKKEFFRDHTEEAFFAINEHALYGLKLAVVFITVNHFRPAHAEFIAFPAHGLDENGQLKFPPALDQDTVPFFSLFHLDGHVPPGFLHQAAVESGSTGHRSRRGRPGATC
jgi:hypothetical protein